MTAKLLVATCAVAALAVAAASAASAQQQPAAPPVSHGPAINNICIISVEGAIGGSTVGKYVQTRMEQIVGQVNAELNAEKTALDNEAKSLEAARGSTAQDAWEKRAADLQVRANALQRKAQLRDREISATEQKAIGRISQEIEPLLRTAYQQRQCSILFQRNAVVIANPAMDVTPQVVQALNGKITQFAFERERLDQAAPATARPATAPAQPAPRR